MVIGILNIGTIFSILGGGQTNASEVTPDANSRLKFVGGGVSIV